MISKLEWKTNPATGEASLFAYVIPWNPDAGGACNVGVQPMATIEKILTINADGTVGQIDCPKVDAWVSYKGDPR